MLQHNNRGQDRASGIISMGTVTSTGDNRLETAKRHDQSKVRADRDVVALGIAAAAIIMFVGTGGAIMPQILRSWMGTGDGPSTLLVNAVLLNIALIIFGWRRYRELLGEIEERRRAEEKARELAHTDPLTGCLNRRSVGEQTDRLIGEQAAIGGRVAFLMIDLDNFKQINDYHGHSSGDRLLVTVADRMRELLPPGAILARIGGDEFACVAPCTTCDADQIGTFAARLVERVSKPVRFGEHPVEITVSVGIATTDNGAEDAARLMHYADVAMYHAKKLGKNRCCWFEPALENALRMRQRLEQGIRQGIDNSEFVPFYEQQVDLQTLQLTGFEMLARWDNPEMIGTGPETFIPVAEDMGLIADLSFMVIGKALDDAKQWDPRLTLSVNISPYQLRDPWFSQKLLKLLVEHNFPPERLDVEITENALLENLALVRSMITSLRNQGVRISLDDFGTGYSSLAQLRNLPFDRLKIDRSFVSELREDGSGAKIVDAIIRLGDGLDMPVTAEGVEDEVILAALAKFHSLKAQGYHFGRPENAAEVRTRLAGLGLLLQDATDGPEAPEVQAPKVSEPAPARRQA